MNLAIHKAFSKIRYKWVEVLKISILDPRTSEAEIDSWKISLNKLFKVLS